MIELRAAGVESWLNPKHAKKLAAELASDLWQRVRGQRGLFVTLTYDREKWESARELYHRSGEERHVALFIRKIGRYLKRDLRGRWFCKVEFQAGGWVHFHLLVLGVEKIPHDVCTRLWGHGFVWLKRMNQKNVRYCCKYVSKGAGLPRWLYLERPRSVRIVRVSRGFWPDACKRDDDGEDDTPVSEPSFRLVGVYRPIGEAFERGEAVVARDDNGRYLRRHCDLAMVLSSLLAMGCSVLGARGGWLRVDASLTEVGRAMEAAAGWAQAHPAAPLHLRGTGLSDAGEAERYRSMLPRYVDEYFEEQAREACDA